VQALVPVAIVNATAFSARGTDGTTPLDAADAPVFQLALATADRAAWAQSARGLSPADLAMHVVLPEVDGRIFAGVASFKSAAARDPALQFCRSGHRSDPDRVQAIAARIAGWAKLRAQPPEQTTLALVLSTYPGKAHQMAHAVGLDALASAEAILQDLAQAGYIATAPTALAGTLKAERIRWPLAAYARALTWWPHGAKPAPIPP
jgi:cobaltochelatase CobN